MTSVTTGDLTNSTPGTPNTGGGGGGGAYYRNIGGSDGGSGIVIVRYKCATSNISYSCGTDYYHDGSDCVACPTGSTRLPDTDNKCLCPVNYHRKVEGGVYSCAACAQGTTRPAGDTVPGGIATTCDSTYPAERDAGQSVNASQPPLPPPSPPPKLVLDDDNRAAGLASFIMVLVAATINMLFSSFMFS